MSIRKALKEDAEKINNLVTSLSVYFLSTGQKELPRWFSNTLTKSKFENRLNDNEYLNFVYEIKNDIVAFISINTNGHLYHLFVSREYQRKGISKKLWNKILTECKLSKYTVRSSLYAVPIYKKFGFQESDKVGEKDGIEFQPMEYKC